MFDFGNANEQQKQAIIASDGPVLIIAGPGTGKTYTLVKRAIYLIEEKKVAPEEIMIATFTEKAAKELITRITDELTTRNIKVNVNEMYVGTFHSICLRILKEHKEYTMLRRNYRVLDSFDQQYMVFRNIYKFNTIKNIETFLGRQGKWEQAGKICGFVNNLSEELVDENKLINDSDTEIKAIGEMLVNYKKLLMEENAVDFSSIQTETYNLLIEYPEIRKELKEKIKYIMVDEYQDTNYIQEKIIFLIGDGANNICVVGDDDQGLYRFRGATIRNILEFPQKFKCGECQIIKLVVNYRSDKDIVNFYNEWMQTTAGRDFKFYWKNYRYEKKIIPFKNETTVNPAVVKLSSKDDIDEWHESILNFIVKLKTNNVIHDFNQIAFLFSSVKNESVVKLAKFLEDNNINVYSPRSDMYFKRDEVKFTLGCLLLMFPKYVQKLESAEYKYLGITHVNYYKSCMELVIQYLKDNNDEPLKSLIKYYGLEHMQLMENTDYAYTGLIYRLYSTSYFMNILNTDLQSGVTDIRPIRNLSKLTEIISKFEYLHNISTLSKKYIDKNTELLFNLYLKLLIDEGISEYEDDSEYAPSGCVSFLTIHQSKGMEFPVVIVDSLKNVPRKKNDDYMVNIEEKYFHRPAFEPYDEIKYFDFWRLYYTAFSRAQNLLILSCNEDKRTPSKYFEELYLEIPTVDHELIDLKKYKIEDVKDVNIKETYSFTSNITVYQTCARQYKYYKELGFTPVRAGAMLFGTLVHETIEDVHKAVLKGNSNLINQANIEKWFIANYDSLIKAEHTYLAEPQRNAALKQVFNYVDRKNGNWDDIKEAEVDVSLVKDDYIIKGKVDLIEGKDDTVEIVDFKSEKKPDMELDRDRLEQYRNQLNVYAHIVEEKTGKKVSKMKLYYTGEENSNPIIEFPYRKKDMEKTIESFDNIVHKIMDKDFTQCSSDAKVCQNCDFRFYCSKK